MSKAKRLEVVNEIKQMSLAWNLSMRETMEEMLCHYYDSIHILTSLFHVYKIVDVFSDCSLFFWS